LGSIPAAAGAAAVEGEEKGGKEEEATTEGPSVPVHANAKASAVYKRLLLLKLELLLGMGIERKKTKTRRPSWRRATSEQRRCAKQLIPLSGSKPAKSRPLRAPRSLNLSSPPTTKRTDPVETEREGKRGDIFLFSSPGGPDREIGCFASAKSGFRPNAIKFLGFARLPAPTIALPLKCPEVRIHC